jgi:manganese/zinc/iron transport system ATP- binding protein
MTPVLDIHDVTVAYQRKPVLWDVDLVIDQPRLAAIVGPERRRQEHAHQGALGLVPMASGRVAVFGRPLREVRRQIGYVPQRESVDWDFPVSVLDVVLMGTYGELGWFRRPGKRQRDWARNAWNGSASRSARQQIGQLSGGQQQRVFLARALAQRGGHVLHGRADGRRRRGDRADDLSRARGIAGRRARRSSPSITTCGPCPATSTMWCC